MIEKKLKREKADGMQIGNDIFIDPRLEIKNHLETLVHETLHVALPDLSEKEVCRVSKIISKVLWSQNYRRLAS